LLNAILGEIGCTQGGTATKFRAFQYLHLNQSLNKCQAFFVVEQVESGDVLGAQGAYGTTADGT
jgi:hypothetical protein